MKRKSFPKAVETQVLIECRRRCALCFWINGDTAVKHGQIAHIDRNSQHVDANNAAFLCLRHHSEYDSRSRQAKGFTSAELQKCVDALHQALATPEFWLIMDKSHRTSRDPRKSGVSLAVYDRRLPIYKTAMQFVREVMSDLKPQIPAIQKFAGEIDEALFLFDVTIANYLTDLYQKALRLRAVALKQERGTWTDSLGEEELELSTWFSNQFQEVRNRFRPFLQINSGL